MWVAKLIFKGFPGGSDSKQSACHVGDPGSIPGTGRSPGEGNAYPFQYSCLENSMDEESGGLQARGCKDLDTTERLTLSLGNRLVTQQQRLCKSLPDS